MKTFSAKGHEVQRDWFVIDATDLVLGRVASEVALRLRGKHKPEFTPHVDTGDYIVIINASKIKVTGTKNLDKVYYRHSGFPGGITATNFRDLGGYIGHRGQQVKWRRIFRSDHLAALTPQDQALLADLGVARAVVSVARDLGPKMAEEGLQQALRGAWMTNFAQLDVKQMREWVAKAESAPLPPCRQATATAS